MNARPRVLLAAAITLWLALPAAAARVVQMRVGEHPGFTRIVFELDAPAGYQVERKAGAAELTVTLEASSEARKVTRKSWDIRSVDVAAAQRAIARIRLANPGLQLKEMILSNPPRIVLDVVREKPVVARAKKSAAPRQAEAKLAPPRAEDALPAVPKTRKAEVAPPSAAKPVAEPTPAGDAKPAAPTKPVAKSEPIPAPKPEAKPAAAPKPAAETKPVADAKPPAPSTPAKPTAKPVEKPIADSKSAAKPAETTPTAPKAAEAPKPPADAKAAAPKAETPATASADAKSSATPAESKPSAEAPKPAATSTPPGTKPVMTASDLTKLVAEQLAQKNKETAGAKPATPPSTEPATPTTTAAKPSTPTPPPGATTQIEAKQPAPPPSAKTAEAKPPAPATPSATPADAKLPAPVPPPPTAVEVAKPAPAPTPAPAANELAKPAPAPAPPIEVAKPAPPPPPAVPAPAPPKPAAKPEAVAKPAAAKPTDSAQSGSGWLSNPLMLGAAAGVLLCVVGLVLVLRRRRALPNDLDVTAIAEARDDAEAAAYGTSNVATTDDSFSLFEGDDSTSAQATAPALRNTRPAASEADDASFASLFDEEDAHGATVSQGAATMNQPTTSDFPMDRASSDRTAATVATPRPASAAPGADVMRLVQDLERRMGMLEKKLGEANDAREKLERQVAAQSEELRVQRAAIARTQRALRTMTRGEEDKATEPALREDPSGQTQSKTRINL